MTTRPIWIPALGSPDKLLVSTYSFVGPAQLRERLFGFREREHR